MTDQQFMDHAEAALKAIEAGCDRLNDETDADIDNQRTGGMLTLTFRDRSQIVLNLQKPLHEIWLAARSGGRHYRFQDGCWADTRGGGDLFTTLSRDASAQAGMALRFFGSGGLLQKT